MTASYYRKTNIAKRVGEAERNVCLIELLLDVLNFTKESTLLLVII